MNNNNENNNGNITKQKVLNYLSMATLIVTGIGFFSYFVYDIYDTCQNYVPPKMTYAKLAQKLEKDFISIPSSQDILVPILKLKNKLTPDNFELVNECYIELCKIMRGKVWHGPLSGTHMPESGSMVEAFEKLLKEYNF